jgi:hypothetical protein
MHPAVPFSRGLPLGEARLWGCAGCRRVCPGAGRGYWLRRCVRESAIGPWPHALHAKGTRCLRCGMLTDFTAMPCRGEPRPYIVSATMCGEPPTRRPRTVFGTPARGWPPRLRCVDVCNERPLLHAPAVKPQRPAQMDTQAGPTRFCQHDNVRPARMQCTRNVLHHGTGNGPRTGQTLCQARSGHHTAHSFAS